METNFKGTRGKVKKHIEYDKKYKQPVISIDVGNYDCVATIWTGLDKGQEIRKEDLANSQLIVDAFNIRQQINFDLPELLERYNELERWKKEASSVFSQIDFQGLGGLLNIQLGTSISEQLQTKVVELLNVYNKAVELLKKAETQLNPSTFYGENEIVAKEIEQFLKTLEK